MTSGVSQTLTRIPRSILFIPSSFFHLFYLFIFFFYLDFFTFDFFFLAVVSTDSPAGVKWSKRISVGSVAVQNHDRASPRFTAKLLFRDWQPVNDSMLEQIWPLLSLYVRVPTGCLWSVWYTTSNRISRRTDFCHRENRHCTWFPDRNDVSVDFWIGKGWAVATATMKTGIDENDIANRHCQPTLLQTERSVVISVSPESCFDNTSTCRLEYFLREGVVDVTRFCCCKWKVSIQFFGTEQNWDRFEYSYQKVRESTREAVRQFYMKMVMHSNSRIIVVKHFYEYVWNYWKFH